MDHLLGTLGMLVFYPSYFFFFFPVGPQLGELMFGLLIDSVIFMTEYV